jgi:hypothetical protein
MPSHQFTIVAHGVYYLNELGVRAVLSINLFFQCFDLISLIKDRTKQGVLPL